MEKGQVSEDMRGRFVSFVWDGDAPDMQPHRVIGRVVDVNVRDRIVDVRPMDEPYGYHLSIDKVRFV